MVHRLEGIYPSYHNDRKQDCFHRSNPNRNAVLQKYQNLPW